MSFWPSNSISSFPNFPLKETFPIDINKKIYENIKQNYKKSYSKEREKDSTNELDSLRNELVQHFRSKTENEHTIAIVSKYYDQMNLLNEKVQILPPYHKDVDMSGVKNKNAVTQLCFTWYNAYDNKSQSERIRNFTGRFDMNCCLLNLAILKGNVAGSIYAINAQTASTEEANSEMSLLALKHFSSAASILNYLIEKNGFTAQVPGLDTSSLTDDLKRPYLEALKYLYLAQGQEVLLKSPKATKMSSSIQAGLCQQASVMFLEAKNHFDSPEIANKIKPWDWQIKNVLQAKSELYAGLAHYHQAIIETDSSLYGKTHGLAIKRLEISKSHLKLAKSFANKVKQFSDLETIIEHFMSKIGENLKVYIKDNDFIFQNPIPNEVTGIVGKQMVRVDEGFDENSRVSAEEVKDIVAYL